MPLIKKVIQVGNSKAVSLPKSWLELIERETGKSIKEVTMEVNGILTIRPIIPKKSRPNRIMEQNPKMNPHQSSQTSNENIQDSTNKKCEPENKTVSPNPTKQPNKTQTPDCVTTVNIHLDGPREPCSFRCNKKLWKAFVQKIKHESLSTCHVLEPFILAYVTSIVYVSNTNRPCLLYTSPSPRDRS